MALPIRPRKQEPEKTQEEVESFLNDGLDLAADIELNFNNIPLPEIDEPAETSQSDSYVGEALDLASTDDFSLVEEIYVEESYVEESYVEEPHDVEALDLASTDDFTLVEEDPFEEKVAEKAPIIRPSIRDYLNVEEDILGHNQDDLLDKKLHRRFTRTKPKEEVVVIDNRPKFSKVLLGDITSKFAVEGDYRLYEHLDKPIGEMVTYIQETLSEKGDSNRVAEARQQRGTEFYQDTAQMIDRLITRKLAAADGISVEYIDSKHFTAAVRNEILGFGPLEPLWQDPKISEIMVNGPNETRVEVNGKTLIATGVRFRDTNHANHVAVTMLASTGRTFNTKMPYADGSLPDGSRINAIHTEIAPDGPYLTIRRFPDTIFSMEKLVELNSMTEEMALIIGNIIHAGYSIVVSGGTGTGKAININTYIPTPKGFVKLKDLCVGDEVFDEKGKPCKITGYYPQPLNTCYKVEFSDGSHVIADGEHNWFVNTAQDVQGSVKTTHQIIDEFEDYKFFVKPTLPVQYAEKDLKIDPYLLGMWLFKGNNKGQLENPTRDMEDVLTERGHDHFRELVKSKKGSVIRLEVDGLAEALSAEGILRAAKDKSDRIIPEKYLEGSEDQRRALLAGILDAVGAVRQKGLYIDITHTGNSVLMKSIQQLINSLGYVARINLGEKQDIVFFNTMEHVFYAQDNHDNHQSLIVPSKNVRYITSVKSAETVPVACISVDSPNNLYLYGSEYNVTHNTSMLNALSGCIPSHERIITVEDTLELRLNPNKHVLRLRSRPANANGQDAVTIRDLVRNTLRMRPERIIVGEVRDFSAYDMMQAMSTGHDGSLTTTHASNARGTINRLTNLITEAGDITADGASAMIAGAVDVIITISRFAEDGSRRVSGIYEVPTVVGEKHGKPHIDPVPIYEFVRDGFEDDNKTIKGHYAKINDFSEEFVEKHSLDKRHHLTIEELYKLSHVDSPVPEKDTE